MINSTRIQAICKCVTTPVVVEVGADHGHITKTLFENKKIKYAYLTDISSKCLQKAINNFKNTQYENNCSFLVGDGLQALVEVNFSLTPPVGQVIIAGMGGMEIIKILQNKVNTYSNFVLQPQRNVVDLRKFLISNGFEIEEDFIVKEEKFFYNILKVKKSKEVQNLTLQEILFGKTNIYTPSEDFKNYVKYKLQKLESYKTTKFEVVQEIEELKKLL